MKLPVEPVVLELLHANGPGFGIDSAATPQGQPVVDDRKLGLRLGESDARFEAADGCAVLGVMLAGAHNQRNDELRGFVAVGSAGLEHADHRIGLVLDADLLADDRGVGVQVALPETMRDDDKMIVAGSAFVGQEVAAERHREAEVLREEAGRHGPAVGHPGRCDRDW